MNNRIRDIPKTRAITAGFKLLGGFAMFALSAAFVSGFSSCRPDVITLKFWDTYPPVECTGDQGLLDSLLGAATFGYKGGVGDLFIYLVLVGVAAVGVTLGALLLAFRDADPKSVAEAAASDSPPLVQATSNVNFWPVLGAFAVGTAAVGLVFNPATFVGGSIAVIVVGLMWTIKDWSDHVSSSRQANDEAREVVTFGLDAPVIAGLLIGATAMSISRVLLTVDATTAWILAMALATLVFGAAILIAYVPKVSQSVVAGVVMIFGVVIVGSGIVAAINGEREFENHAEGGHAESGEEVEGDHDAESEAPEGDHEATDEGAGE